MRFSGNLAGLSIGLLGMAAVGTHYVLPRTAPFRLQASYLTDPAPAQNGIAQVQSNAEAGRAKGDDEPRLEREPIVSGTVPSTILRVPLSARVARLAENFENEPMDPQWAPGVESALYTAIQSSGVRVMRVDAECRTTICRIDVSPVEPVYRPLEGNPRFRSADQTARMLIDAFLPALREYQLAAVRTDMGLRDPTTHYSLTFLAAKRETLTNGVRSE